eukprot:COSAG02_NODE_349_length_24073_cov_102.816092_27_plen_64_part_00
MRGGWRAPSRGEGDFCPLGVRAEGLGVLCCAVLCCLVGWGDAGVELKELGVEGALRGGAGRGG